MSDISLQSKKVMDELRHIDAATGGRLLAQYERCPGDQRLAYVAAIVSALCVSEVRRRAKA
jgi:hypothetical protein